MVPLLGAAVDKGTALTTLARRLNIPLSQTMAIGDSSSDFEIIKRCGLGVAMGNAPDNIKAAADVVTGLNTEDGLAEAFEKYVL